MDERLVYAKTSKGAAEVAARGGALSLAVRRVLIMIDGKRTVAELAPLLRPGEIGGVLHTLESMGFVQAMQGAETTARAAAHAGDVDGPTTVGHAAEERVHVTLEDAKRRAVRELNDRLGPEAEVMAMRIEQCRTADEFRERMREAERLVSGMMGEAVAQEFMRALRRRG